MALQIVSKCFRPEPELTVYYRRWERVVGPLRT